MCQVIPLEKKIAHSFFDYSDGWAMMMALINFIKKVDGGLFHGLCNKV